MTAAADYLTSLVQAIGSSPSPQDVVDVLVPEAADLVQVFARHGDELRLVAYRHIDPEHHPVLEELAKIHRPSIDHPTDPVAHVMRTGEARLITWVTREDVERVTPDNRVHAMFDVLQPRNIVFVPLCRENTCYGALVVTLSSSGRRFMEGDLEFMREFGAKVGPAIRFP
jgi:GAF domain-containing protein